MSVAFAGEPSRLNFSTFTAPADLRDLLLHGGLDHLLAQLVLLLVEARRLRGTVLDHLDHVPAELGLHRGRGNLAILQREGDSGELRHHVGLFEVAKVAALLRRARILAVLLGQRGEIAALLQFGNDLLRGRLVGDQNMAGMHLGFAGLAGDVLVIAGLDDLIGHLRANHFVEQCRFQRPVLRRLHGALNVGVLVEAGASAPGSAGRGRR